MKQLTEQIIRIDAEADIAERDKPIRRYFLVLYQRIWRVLISVDRVLSANVLATRLDPNPETNTEASVSPTIDFEALKFQLTAIEVSLEPFIFEDLDEEGEMFPNAIMCKQNKKNKDFKRLNKLERMIDQYLVRFEKVDKNSHQTLIKSSLYLSLMHKKKR